MAANLFIMDAANLFVGNADPNSSEHLALKSVKIPALVAKTKEHMGAGAATSINIRMSTLEPLDLSFKLEGFNPVTMAQFMSPERADYTIRGNVRDIVSQREIAVVAVVTGHMVKVDGSEFSKDGGIEHDYQIAEIVRYSLTLDSQEKFYFDHFGGIGTARRDGQPMFGAAARNLGLA